MATCGYTAAQVKVHVCGLGLLLPRLNGGPVCDDSATEGSMCECNAVYMQILPLHCPDCQIFFCI